MFPGMAQQYRHGRQIPFPGGFDASLRARIPNGPNEIKESRHLSFGGDAGGFCICRRPVGHDQQRCQLIVRPRQFAPDLFRDERHDRVQQAQVRVQRVEERPPRSLARCLTQAFVRETDLGQFYAPVAELVPDGFVQDLAGVAERVLGHGRVDGRDRGRGPGQDPQIARAGEPAVGPLTRGIARD